MFTPNISRTLIVERERRNPHPTTSGNNGVKDIADHVSGGQLTRIGKRRLGQRRWSLAVSARQRRQLKRQLHPPVIWNMQGMRGKMPSNCLCIACQALFIGILLFSVGGVMSYLGFEADGVFTNNSTAVAGGRAYFYEDARGANVKFSKLSYAGPIVMGVGVAACVMTFEARDSAAKVSPAAYVASDETIPCPIITKPRPIRRCVEVCSTGTQTTEHSSTDALHNLNIFDKRNLLETFRKFSKTVRQSSSKEEDIQRYPSAPNLLDEEDPTKSNVPKSAAIAARRSSCLPKFRNRVPPVLLRQAMSIDCSTSSPFLASTSAHQSHLSQTLLPTTSGGHSSTCMKGRRVIHRSKTNTSANSDTFIVRGSGSGENLCPLSQPASRAASTVSVAGTSGAGNNRLQTGSVDLHLPNGMVTLNVVQTTGGNVLGGSSHSLRTLTPHASNDSSFDMGSSVKSDNILLPKSPMKPFKCRSESFGRPSLVRQSKVDQAEIYIPDSDDEQQQPIPEAEHESYSDSS